MLLRNPLASVGWAKARSAMPTSFCDPPGLRYAHLTIRVRIDGMKRGLDFAQMEAAFKRAAYKAIHGTREERAGWYQPVESTTMTSIRYVMDVCELRLAFKDGGVYRYQDVPLEIYLALLGAASKGRFFDDHIKDRFPTTQLSRDRTG